MLVFTSLSVKTDWISDSVEMEQQFLGLWVSGEVWSLKHQTQNDGNEDECEMMLTHTSTENLEDRTWEMTAPGEQRRRMREKQR